MRALPLLILAFALGCDSRPATTPAASVGKTLGPGDPAPPLTVAKWLHGSPVEIKPGTVYVVDFWATWCGPCLRAMPHLDSLAREYGPQGAEFVAVTTADQQGNTLSRVEQFMKETGRKTSIHFAWCENTTTYDNWMDAAGISGIPTFFVIDRDGKIAHIGHNPIKLDDILPRVLAGTWRGKPDLDEIDAVQISLNNIFDRVQAAGGNATDKLPLTTTEEKRQEVFGKAAAAAAPIALAELDEFARKHPRKAGSDDVLANKMMLLMRLKKMEEAKAIAVPLLERLRTSHDYDMIDNVRRYWLGKALNPERQHMEVPVSAVEMLVAICTDENMDAALAAAETYAAAGDMEKFEAYARKARLLTALDAERGRKVESLLKSFQK